MVWLGPRPKRAHTIGQQTTYRWYVTCNFGTHGLACKCNPGRKVHADGKGTHRGFVIVLDVHVCTTSSLTLTTLALIQSTWLHESLLLPSATNRSCRRSWQCGTPRAGTYTGYKNFDSQSAEKVELENSRFSSIWSLRHSSKKLAACRPRVKAQSPGSTPFGQPWQDTFSDLDIPKIDYPLVVLP